MELPDGTLVSEVKPAPQYLKRIKNEVLFDIEGWQEALRGSQEETEWEERLRRSIGKLLDWKETRGLVEQCNTVCELQKVLREDLGKKYKDAPLVIE